MEEPCCKKPPNHFSLAWAYFSKLSKGKDRVSVAESRNELPGFPCLVSWCPDKLPVPSHPLEALQTGLSGVLQVLLLVVWAAWGRPSRRIPLEMGHGCFKPQAVPVTHLHANRWPPAQSQGAPAGPFSARLPPGWAALSQRRRSLAAQRQCAWLRVGVGLVRSLSSWSLPSG